MVKNDIANTMLANKTFKKVLNKFVDIFKNFLSLKIKTYYLK